MNTSSKNLKWIFLGLALVVTLFDVSYQYDKAVAKVKAEERGMANPAVCRNEDGDWVKIPAGKYKDRAGDCLIGTPPPPVPPRTVVPAERPWTFRTLEIPANGELAVHLSQGWRGFTQGGAVTITTPGGQIFHDRPGVPTDMGFQPDGIYIFHSDPIGSKRSMAIYNRW
jgi:hypothetical protein